MKTIRKLNIGSLMIALIATTFHLLSNGSCSVDNESGAMADKEKFINESTKPDQYGDTNTLYLNSKPCQFLKDKNCTIYELRPEECHAYPYLHKDDFTSRLFGVIENYEICPIVYNVYELLKLKLNFKTSL